MTKIKMVLALAIGVFLYVPPSAYAQKFYLDDNLSIKNAERAIVKGDLARGADYYRQAIKSGLDKDRLLPTLNNLCLVEYALGNAEASEEACTLAIKEDRRFWQAYVNRGNARAALGNVTAAADDYKTAARLNPGNVEVEKALSLLEKSKLYASAQ